MVYPEELKTAIVAQHKKGVSVKQLSTEYGICARTIYRWANIYGGNQVVEMSNDPQQYSAKEYHTHVRLYVYLLKHHLCSKNRKLYSSCSIKREAA